MAVYNGENYIREQLDSILNQSVKVDEIIISDDGSSDNTVEIIKQYIYHHENDKIILVINNGIHGFTGNFENAFRCSSADFLFFCDQDDVWKENKVECFLKCAKEYPEYGLYFSNATLTDSQLQSLGQSLWGIYYPEHEKDCMYSVLGGESLVRRLSARNIVTGMSSAVRRDVLQKVFPMHPSLFHDEMIACYCSVNGGFVSINEETAFYRQHGKNSIGIDGSMYVADNKRRNNLVGLIKYSDQNMPIINHLYHKCAEYVRYDGKQSFAFLRMQYAFLEKIYISARSNKIQGAVNLLQLFAKGEYSKYEIHQSTKLFVLDMAMILFVSTKQRREFFQEN